jgi:hypothetical protein
MNFQGKTAEAVAPFGEKIILEMNQRILHWLYLSVACHSSHGTAFKAAIFKCQGRRPSATILRRNDAIFREAA